MRMELHIFIIITTRTSRDIFEIIEDNIKVYFLFLLKFILKILIFSNLINIFFIIITKNSGIKNYFFWG